MPVVKINGQVVAPVISKKAEGYYSVTDLMSGVNGLSDGNFPTLTNWTNYSLSTVLDPTATTFNAPNLKSMSGGASFGNTRITSINCPQLGSITAQTALFVGSYISELVLPNLVSINMESVDFCTYNGLRSCVKISLPALKSITCKDFLYHSPNLAEVDLSSLEELEATYAFDDLPTLQTIDLPKVKKITGYLLYGTMPALRSLHIGSAIETINANTFIFLAEVSTEGLVITIDKAEGEIPGAPWGLKDTLNAQIVYNPITE